MSKRFIMTRTRVGLITIMSLALAGCVGVDSETIPSVIVEETSTTETTIEEESGATAGDAADEDPEATIGVEPDLLALEELWAELWSATGLVPDERPAAIAALGESLDPTVAELAPNLLPESTLREVYTFPVFRPAADGTMVEIEDCIIYDPEIFESITHVHSGTAILDADGDWVIDSIERVSRGCIPAELNAEILADYEEYWDASRQYWNPPDPRDPGIDSTMTGEYRELIRERVRLDQVDGFLLVQDHLAIHPEIAQVFSADRIEVRDCVETHPDDGVFDADGERADGSEPRSPGETDLYTTSMVLEGGQWKTSDVTVQINEECSSSPIPGGLQVVGDA